MAGHPHPLPVELVYTRGYHPPLVDEPHWLVDVLVLDAAPPLRVAAEAAEPVARRAEVAVVEFPVAREKKKL